MDWPAVVELRQYTLRTNSRDILVRLFEAEFFDSQFDAGITILGTFLDADDPDRFVWMRGFENFADRAISLNTFYTGSSWQAHRDEANGTMLDSDNVLLLRPLELDSIENSELESSSSRGERFEVVVANLSAPADEKTLSYFESDIVPRLASAGATLVGCFVTESHANTFPALPVREGEDVFVWLTQEGEGAAQQTPQLEVAIGRIPNLVQAQVLHLQPTARSPIGGFSRARI